MYLKQIVLQLILIGLTLQTAIGRVISPFQYKSCEVDVTWLITATEECECFDINDDFCQLQVRFNYDAITCKRNASLKCKTAISRWAEAYEHATNAEECKHDDPKYRTSQNAAISCK